MNLLDPKYHSDIWVKLGEIFPQKMSVTSSATASRDWKVPPTNSFCNRLCLLAITRGDGTPMDASSILEEDIIEICVRKGHTYPLGVLHYLAMESIILFGTVDDLDCESHGLVDVTEFQDEAVTVQTMAPLQAHVATFTSVWHSKPTSGDGELHTPPQQTPPSEGTPCHLYAQLGDLNDNELQQLIKDLLQEIVQCELTAPPQQPPPNEWVYPLGSREPKEDDQKVTFPGGGRWGPLRQPTPVPEQPAGGRVPFRHPSNCHVLHQQDQTWGS